MVALIERTENVSAVAIKSMRNWGVSPKLFTAEEIPGLVKRPVNAGTLTDSGHGLGGATVGVGVDGVVVVSVVVVNVVAVVVGFIVVVVGIAAGVVVVAGVVVLVVVVVVVDVVPVMQVKMKIMQFKKKHSCSKVQNRNIQKY